MKKYIRRRVKMFIEFFVILVFVCLLNKSSYNNVISSVSLNTNVNKALDIKIIENSQQELYKASIYDPIYSFVGELTGYAGDCPLCSGYLACPPRTNVLEKGVYYDDKTYGNIRIVASSKKYPCGSIVRFKVNKLSKEPIIAIVLDRGVGGNVIDLLTENEDYAIKKVGRVRNLEFEVLRNGWKNE